ncbi:MAG TPA: ABATE domain-containing protein [Myxococcales bacterium]|nr:ABATE domain-containing protein [Myxococcales bacterium]
MSETMRQEPYRFEFVGGETCLDFTNTVGGDRRAIPREHLHGYADLVAWARQGELITPAQARTLLLRAQREPVAASAALAAAVELREALFEIFFSLTEGKRPPQQRLEVLNRALAEALAHRRVVQAGREFSLGWDDSDDLRRMLWPVALSAAELLAGHYAPVKVCGMWEEGECGWLFVDESRNGSRRWCSMKDCGNRAKARRHYQKVKKLD